MRGRWRRGPGSSSGPRDGASRPWRDRAQLLQRAWPPASIGAGVGIVPPATADPNGSSRAATCCRSHAGGVSYRVGGFSPARWPVLWPDVFGAPSCPPVRDGGHAWPHYGSRVPSSCLFAREPAGSSRVVPGSRGGGIGPSSRDRPLDRHTHLQRPSTIPAACFSTIRWDLVGVEPGC